MLNFLCMKNTKILKQTPKHAARKSGSSKKNESLPKMNEFDMAVLAIVNNVSLKESISRLYRSGEIDRQKLCECVTRGFIDLAEYNEIMEGLNK